MEETDWLARRFEDGRPRLRGVAYRMLGSLAEADDAVQEAWLHASRKGADEVSNLDGWLTTIVARVCLDMLRSRKSRREDPLDIADIDDAATPEEEAVMADSVGLAMLVVLDALSPAERVAFVLHDMFEVPFEQIAAATGRSATAARQLASRARRRVRGASTDPNPDLDRKRRVVEAFFAAAREGDFEALVAVLDPDVVLYADAASRPPATPEFTRGAALVASGALTFRRRAPRARLALVNGEPALILAPLGHLRLVMTFTIDGDAITAVDVSAEPASLRELEISLI